MKYSVYNGKNKVFIQDNFACYAEFFRLLDGGNPEWTHVDVELREYGQSVGLTDFWVGVIKDIIPNTKKITEKDIPYIRLPKMNKGRIKVMLSIVRFLWENNSLNCDIPSRVKKILEEYPDMDKMKAIYIAAIKSSINSDGHGIINGLPHKLPTIKSFRSFRGNRVFDHCETQLPHYEACDLKEKIRHYTVKDILEFYEKTPPVSKEPKKIKVSLKSLSLKK